MAGRNTALTGDLAGNLYLLEVMDYSSMPLDEWEPWPCADEDDPEAMGCMGEDDPDNWLDEADEDEPEQWDWDVVA